MSWNNISIGTGGVTFLDNYNDILISTYTTNLFTPNINTNTENIKKLNDILKAQIQKKTIKENVPEEMLI